MTLHSVVGHTELRTALARAHAADALPAALLLHGPRGVGKQRAALWVAQLTVCQAPSAEGPCNTCGPCRMALKLEHPDVHWYFPVERPKASGDRLVEALEDARAQGLASRREHAVRTSHYDELRGLYLGIVQNIRRRAHMRPTMAPGQVFIIGDAELLVPQEASPEAANALLKLLEEPPGGARFILTSGESGRLPATILSRTVPLHVAPLTPKQVTAFLEQTAGRDADTAAWAAGLSQGSIGRALGFLPDGDDLGPLESLRRRALEIVEAAIASNSGPGYAISLGFPPAGARKLIPLFAFVEEWLRDLGAVASGASDNLLNRDSLTRLTKMLDGTAIHPSGIALAIAEVDEAREFARGNVNPQLVVSGLVRALRARLLSRRPLEVA